MKVFLSWSGERSQAVAQALREWLPNVVQAVQPWLSSSDIDTGARWSNEISIQLKESRIGIICLTPENLTAPWVMFEAGALYKNMEGAFVCPYLFGFDATELKGPLIQFQASPANRDGTNSLVRTINRALGESALEENRIEKAFDLWWPLLDAKLRQLASRRSEFLSTRLPLPSTEKGAPSDLRANEKFVGLLLEVINKLGSVEKRSSTLTPEQKIRVFIVHGHNHGLKETVARLVEKLGLAAIILDESPNEGRTIIEKFELLSQVDYSIVILSADDVGAGKYADSGIEYRPRARQNVLFELGFFTAKLGRSRISVLYEEGVEIPSDVSGILYIKIDSEGLWRFKLGQELRTAGLNVDINSIL